VVGYFAINILTVDLMPNLAKNLTTNFTNKNVRGGFLVPASPG